MNYLRFLRRFVLMSAVDDEGGGGGATEAPETSAAIPPAETPVAAPVTSSAPAPKPTMLDAISKGLERSAPVPAPSHAATAPRDPAGRFVPKVGADGQPVPQAAPAVPGEVKPADEEDLTAMPEGLGEKAQGRFQKLANANKELAGKAEMLDRQVSYVRETFATHGVKEDQFEQAVSVIGMINKGDFEGAQRVLEAQLQQLAVMSGKPLGQVDALAQFPDLRQAVDQLQITEQHAMEIARGRAQQHQQQVVQQRTQEQQQTQQRERQAVQDGTQAVDAFCKRMQASDLDYPAIEAQLLPEIPNLLRGVPPANWPGIIETQYRLIKRVAGSARQTAAPTTNALRPTGHGSPVQAPKTAFEAMWGTPAPR